MQCPRRIDLLTPLLPCTASSAAALGPQTREKRERDKEREKDTETERERVVQLLLFPAPIESRLSSLIASSRCVACSSSMSFESLAVDSLGFIGLRCPLEASTFNATAFTLAT